MKIKVLILALLMCFSLLACNKTEPTDGEEIDVLEGYTPSEAKYPFSDADLTKVNMNATFDVTQHTKDAGAAIQPYQLFADGMCLQRDAVNHIWGYAFDTNHIAIKLNEKVYYGNVDEYGDWHVYLPKLNAGGPYEMEIISEVGRKVISNVYIGEVYLFAGQSNMEWQIWISGDVMKELYTDPNVYNENIRLLHIGANPQMTPTQVLSKPINWQGATSESVRTFSAVAYVFGKKLQAELGCPVGLISTALGGTIIEHWLSRDNYVDVSSRYTPVIDNSHPWFLGTKSSEAIFNTLYGINNPSAKLTMSFPYCEGQIPVYYNALSTGRPFIPNEKYCSHYMDIPNEPLYTFGDGLSYTSFTYSDFNVEEIENGFKLVVKVTNSGQYAGDEIVMAFIKAHSSNIARPERELKGFKRVHLAVGETKNVSIILDYDAFKYYYLNDYILEKNVKYDLMIGGNLKTLLKELITIK